MDQAPTKEPFDSWAVVELMGRQVIAGRVTEAVIGGAALIRVDVPEQPERKAVQSWDHDEPAIPAYTRYLGAASIYALNPCTEEIAKQAAQRMRARPPLAFGSPAHVALAGPDDDFIDR